MALAVTTGWRVTGLLTRGPQAHAAGSQRGQGQAHVGLAEDGLRVGDPEQLEAGVLRLATG